MQVLGQYVQVGDTITFPRRNRLTQPYQAEVTRMVGRRAFDASGNSRLLDYDLHTTVFTNG
jgi:hypothetical protein